METAFRYELEHEGADARVRLHGDFDMIGVLKLETELSRLTQDDGLDRLLLDLSDLHFIDSTALGLLIELDQQAKKGEFELELIPGPRHVQRVFEVTQLVDALPFRQSGGD